MAARRCRTLAGVVAGLLLLGGEFSLCHGAVLGFADQPDQNSTNWSGALPDGAQVEHIDFEDHPLGSLDGSRYQASHGATLSVSKAGSPLSVDVRSGAGPGEYSTTGTPAGEGTHAPSNYIGISGWDAFLSKSQPGRLDVSFDQPVFGAGLFTIDLYRESELSIEAFDHPDPDASEANSLGVFSRPSLGTNTYQRNQLYFMGLIDEDQRIRSFRLSFGADGFDNLGVDDVMIASESTSPPSMGEPIPAPGTLAVLGLGGLGLLVSRSRPRRV